MCATIKKLDPETAYELQVSAWRNKNGPAGQEELVGPVSATLHFTTQTNRKCIQHRQCAEIAQLFCHLPDAWSTWKIEFLNLHWTDCLVNGTCVTGECQVSLDQPFGFECMCHSGHYGPRCEHYNPCVLSPCLNGATCVNQTDGTFHCNCAEGFEGHLCSSIPGCPLPCLNNGSCSLYN